MILFKKKTLRNDTDLNDLKTELFMFRLLNTIV